jgi:hypothetical protein
MNDTLAKYKCMYCHKLYTRYANYEKHQLYCRFVYANQDTTGTTEKYDIAPTIDSKEIHILLKTIIQQNIKMGKEIKQLKAIVNTKYKINMSSCLTTKVPDYEFNCFHTHLQIDASHIELLKTTSIVDTFCILFEEMGGYLDGTIPVFCFTLKKMYIYEACEWNEISDAPFAKFVMNLHKILVGLFFTWQQENEVQIKNCSKTNDTYNKMVIHLMNLDLENHSTLTKLKKGMFDSLHKIQTSKV